MEIDNEPNPSQIKSLLNGSLSVDLNKKRKLEAEHLGLPISKHQCWNQGLQLKPPAFTGVPEVEGYNSCNSKPKGGASYDVSETGSAKDSNSFGEDSYSLHAEAKFGTEDTKYSLYDRSSSFSDWASSSRESHYSSDDTTVASGGVEREVLSSPAGEPEIADVDLTQIPEDSHVEYGSHIDYIYSGYGNYTIEQYQEKEIEEILNSNGANQNVYVLSSGRWSVNQEAPKTTRRPTIDQEFEQYFATLML
ncbi:hypothetical protein COLO4_14776 [Corchorus olitorius]|uniref:Far-red elongated hypocotyl 1 n=1 Tax=Corchorus olitorius TaxID=93759 RepID=A0A1R3JR23_9ROSI|nr:hypothetical protein COLO4_14776 [Corchorus olitorius]